VIPYRCQRQIPSKGRECGKRKSFSIHDDPCETACERCGSALHWTVDSYRLKCRKKPKKDHPPRCDCNGSKTKKAPKFAEHGGIKIVLGPHRRGQYGCQHHPLFGVPEQDDREEEVPF